MLGAGCFNIFATKHPKGKLARLGPITTYLKQDNYIVFEICEGEGERERGEREREKVCVRVRVCVRERERETFFQMLMSLSKTEFSVMHTNERIC